MKHIFMPILMGVLGVTAMMARENLLVSPWISVANRPAVGTMAKEGVAWRTDSVLSLNVRYKSSAAEPSAVCASKIAAPLARRYRFGANVNLTRSESWLTIRLTDGEGLIYSSIVVSTDAVSEGNLQPGRWTRIELEADLSQVDLPENLSVELCPQWKADSPVVGDIIPPILVSDAELICTKADGTYADDLMNCSFESWTGGADGVRRPEGWKITGGEVLPAAGAHVVDNGALIAAGAMLTSPAPAATVNDSVRLMFRAYSSEPVVVAVDGVGRSEALIPNRWNQVAIPVGTVPGSGFGFSSTADWILDDIRLESVYSFANPHPAEQELTVTSSENDGPGSLRDVVENAPNYSLIRFDVDKVVLNEPVNLGSKQIYFVGTENLKIYVPAKGAAFSISPSYENGLITFNEIEFVGNVSGPTNGGAVSVSDSRATARMHVAFDKVRFTECVASGSGGAVYVNSPGLSGEFSECIFSNCQAGNGAGVSINNGVSFEFVKTVFAGCTTKSSVGGALAVNSSSAVKVDVLGCVFDGCVSTASSGGAGGVGIQGGNMNVSIGRSLFVGCAGGRGSGVSVYNNTRGNITGLTAIVNCTAVNNTGTSPVFSIASSGSYAKPSVWLINNVATANTGKALAAPGSPEGTNNLLDNCDIEVANPVSHKPNNPSFLNYTDGVPAPDADNPYVYPIYTGGALYKAGARSVVTPAGVELVTDRIISFNSTDPTVLSLGHTEMNEHGSSVADMTADTGLRVWPNPVSTTLHVDGPFDRTRLTDLDGMTVYAGCSSTIDVSSLARGLYLLTIESKGIVKTHKIVVR
ncbi:MAG: T9SS type A sorting domain-containing protein [Bacteroidales bacterium]|nr:T9SS type A sorting domain-containing protein [Bacteroidales bacterium]